MCTAGDSLTPEVRHLVGRLLGEMAATIAAQHGCQPDEVLVGPVDLDPPTPDHGAGQ